MTILEAFVTRSSGLQSVLEKQELAQLEATGDQQAISADPPARLFEKARELINPVGTGLGEKAMKAGEPSWNKNYTPEPVILQQFQMALRRFVAELTLRYQRLHS